MLHTIRKSSKPIKIDAVFVCVEPLVRGSRVGRMLIEGALLRASICLN